MTDMRNDRDMIAAYAWSGRRCPAQSAFRVRKGMQLEVGTLSLAPQAFHRPLVMDPCYGRLKFESSGGAGLHVIGFPIIDLIWCAVCC